ncbi:MAG: hypothetical protein JRN52_00265 [Nitrososphaerota archaeon]|nr:hypothetical protein [Nitrososphaerota archaeon]
MASRTISKIRFSYYESCKIILGVAAIALSLGWGKYVGKSIYLPFYPDSLDVLLGVCIGLFLLLDYARNAGLLSNWRRARISSDAVR